MKTYIITIKKGKNIIMKLYIDACMEIEAKTKLISYISEETFSNIENRIYKVTITEK